MKLFLKKINKNKGFTLVETLVAISIFAMSVTALMGVLASGISNTTHAKQKMTATYLAQEGIEYMRNLRDDFMFFDTSTTSWNDFVAVIASSGCLSDTENYQDYYFCGFSTANFPITLPNYQSDFSNFLFQCSSSNNDCELLVDPSRKYYNSDNDGVLSGFKRKITFTQYSPEYLNGGQEIKVTSTVSWSQGTGGSVSFSENLFNWAQSPQ